MIISRKLYISRESVVTPDGILVGNCPENISKLANACLSVSALLKTGREYLVIDKKGELHEPVTSS